MKKPLKVFFYTPLALLAASLFIWGMKSIWSTGSHPFKSKPIPQEASSTTDSPVATSPSSPIVTKAPFPPEETETNRKLRILFEVFQSKNDNDPRLDQEFNQLSPQAKLAMIQQYQQLKAESRNERGTIVFLIGRNLNSESDFDFLKQVVSEPACQSLNNCSKQTLEKESHTNSVDQVTLSYPQIVALKSLEAYISKNPTSPGALSVLKQAAASKNPIISRMATTIMRTQQQLGV